MTATLLSDETPAPSRRRRRFIGWLAGGLACLGLVAYFASPYWVARAIVYAPNHGKQIDPSGDPDAAELARLGVDQHLRIAVGPPPASLSLWVIHPAESALQPSGRPGGTVLVLHGIRSSKDSMLGLGRLLADNGLRAVLVDLRGHGRSSGDWLTYGVQDARDLSQLLDALETHQLLAGKAGVFGSSYGGAAGIMLAGSDERVNAVVAVASFCSMADVVPVYARSYLPLGSLVSDHWIDGVIERAGRTAHFDPGAARPIDAIQRTRAHVLLIHGGADGCIPSSHSEALHAAAPDRTRLVVVDNEDHDSIMADRTGTLSREGLAWFSQWLDSPGP